MNGMYMRAMNLSQFSSRALPWLEKASLIVNPESWDIIAPHVQARAKLLSDVAPMIDFLCHDEIARDMPAMFKKGIDKEKAIFIIESFSSELERLDDFNVENMEAAARPLADHLGLKVGPVFGVLRIAVTGKRVAPPLFESMLALGRPACLKRLRQALHLVHTNSDLV